MPGELLTRNDDESPCPATCSAPRIEVHDVLVACLTDGGPVGSIQSPGKFLRGLRAVPRG
jgi:hypothetical protein